MKKILLLIAVFGLFTLFNVVDASVCGISNPCGNGPIVAQQPGGRFLKAGAEDCPWWFASNFGRACYTMRAVGVPFVR